MKPLFGNNSRLCVETLEDRNLPSSCQGFGDHVADLAQTLEPNLGVVVSTIAQTEPGALATQVVVDKEAYC